MGAIPGGSEILKFGSVESSKVIIGAGGSVKNSAMLRHILPEVVDQQGDDATK